jgi:hypothetical protein
MQLAPRFSWRFICAHNLLAAVNGGGLGRPRLGARLRFQWERFICLTHAHVFIAACNLSRWFAGSFRLGHAFVITTGIGCGEGKKSRITACGVRTPGDRRAEVQFHP